MPNYYNPYNIYPATYANQMGYSGYGMQPNQMPVQQSYTQPSGRKTMDWVEGEVGAKAFQMPPDLQPNQPIPLWDSTDTIIWLKSWSPMGIPNPMQKLHYTMPEQQSSLLPAGQNEQTNHNSQTNQSNMSGSSQTDMSQYVTKQDLEDIKAEIRNALSGANTIPPAADTTVQVNRNNQNGNRGGNR